MAEDTADPLMISVIIPTYNEERALPATLRHLAQQEGDHEVIVVDGGSTDGTRALLEQDPTIQVAMAPKGRASQMNAGAKLAQGHWLLFLHADTILPHAALNQINEFEYHSDVQAGGFRHQFSGSDWRLRLILWPG